MEARKNILIISPHFPPSNLASVHRSRIFAKHLPAFGWSPIILTIHEKFYEEELDHICDEVDLVGVNNRNLKNFAVDLDQSVRLAEKIGNGKLKIAG